MARDDTSRRRPANKTGNSSRRSSRRQPRDRKEGVQRFDKRDDNMERVPSNAPTMAIAPSDYEHIYHEGPARDKVPANGAAPHSPRPPDSPGGTPFPQAPATNVRAVATPPFQPAGKGHEPGAALAAGQFALLAAGPPQSPEAAQEAAQFQFGHARYGQEVQVTPDGYTLLGHQRDPSRRVPLPPYIVRSSNQFSRAALARVARYLASRAEGQ